MWPLALITKPVPVWLPVLAGFGIGVGASVFAATAFGAVNSPALLIPSALTVVTQFDERASSGAVEVRLNCKALLLPSTATIRLAF